MNQSILLKALFTCFRLSIWQLKLGGNSENTVEHFWKVMYSPLYKKLIVFCVLKEFRMHENLGATTPRLTGIMFKENWTCYPILPETSFSLHHSWRPTKIVGLSGNHVRQVKFPTWLDLVNIILSILKWFSAKTSTQKWTAVLIFRGSHQHVRGCTRKVTVLRWLPKPLWPEYQFSSLW